MTATKLQPPDWGTDALYALKRLAVFGCDSSKPAPGVRMGWTIMPLKEMRGVFTKDQLDDAWRGGSLLRCTPLEANDPALQ